MAAMKDVSVIIFDVGRNTIEGTSKPSFFEREKECVQKILQRKIFSKPKDEVALLLMGTDGTDNELNSELQGYEHISLGIQMAQVTWNMLKYVEYSIEPTNSRAIADWLDAIVVAMDYLRRLAPVKSILKIILLTTFTTNVNQDQVDAVIGGLKELNIELIVISSSIEYKVMDHNGSEVGVFSQVAGGNEVRRNSEELIQRIIDETDGVLCSFDGAIQQLIYFDKMQKRRMPWNTDLEFGTLLQIKVAAYIYIREEPGLSSWKSRGPGGLKCKTVTEYFHNDTKIDLEQLADTIKGYMYGQEPYVYDESIGYDAGGKSLKCIGFTNQSLVRDEYLFGTGIWAVVAQKDCPVAEATLAAMIKVMRDSQLALIVRYVYNARSKPKMMVLFPNNLLKHNPNHNSLLMHELIYKDNMIQMMLPSLKTRKTEPSAEQYEAIDHLIDSMDLTQVKTIDVDSGEPFIGEAFKKLLNPVLQHTYRRIAHRALHPKDPLIAPDDDIITMLNTPASVKELAAPHADKVKELFKLEVVQRDTLGEKFLMLNKVRKLTDDGGIGAAVDADNADYPNDGLVKVGTVTPAEDFAELLERGERIAKISNQMQEVIENLVIQSLVLPEEKVLRAIMMYREQAKLRGPCQYNEWITEFKKLLLKRRKLYAWQKLIIDERFGLITTTENEISAVTDDEAERFYTDIGIRTDDRRTEVEENGNDDDLFANM